VRIMICRFGEFIIYSTAPSCDQITEVSRFKWGHYQDGAADVAIWDNRSVFHTATDDYLELGGIRAGDRVVSLGEKPTLVPGSKSRREALGLPRFGGQKF
jgi:alpha-ketoglutarate-dependent taurine dioxygenase